MNYQEIISEVKKQEISIDEFAYGDMLNPLPNIGVWEEIEQHGGEGEGEKWWSVKYFKDHNIFIKTKGFYASYDGTSFDDFESDCSQVAPIEKVVTVYE